MSQTQKTRENTRQTSTRASRENKSSHGNANKPDGYKYMGHGALGCGFAPHVPCADDEPTEVKGKKTVGKLFGYNFLNRDPRYAFQEEMRLSEMVQKLDPKHVFTPQVFGACKTNQAHLTDRIMKDCPYLALQDAKNNVIYQMIMENGGMPVSKMPSNDVRFLTFINSLHNVMFGLRTFHKNNVVHLDIKPDNMLFDAEKKEMKIIDFGNMHSTSEIYMPLRSNDREKVVMQKIEHYYMYLPMETKIALKLYDPPRFEDLLRRIRKEAGSPQRSTEEIQDLLMMNMMSGRFIRFAFDKNFRNWISTHCGCYFYAITTPLGEKSIHNGIGLLNTNYRSSAFYKYWRNLYEWKNQRGETPLDSPGLFQTYANMKGLAHKIDSYMFGITLLEMIDTYAYNQPFDMFGLFSKNKQNIVAFKLLIFTIACLIDSDPVTRWDINTGAQHIEYVCTLLNTPANASNSSAQKKTAKEILTRLVEDPMYGWNIAQL